MSTSKLTIGMKDRAEGKKLIDNSVLELGNIGVNETPGVGDKISTYLNKLGIETIDDLLHHFPNRYIDLSTVKPIGNIKVGDEVTVKGEVKVVSHSRIKKGMDLVQVGIFDGTGYIYGIWFNQGYIADRLTKGTEVAFSGKTSWSRSKLQIQNPFYDVVTAEEEGDTVNTGRIIPVHSTTKNLSSTHLRKIIKKSLDRYGDLIIDPLPQEILSRFNLLDKSDAIKNMHFPESEEIWRRSRKRLVFEELFILEIGLLFRKKRMETREVGMVHKVDEELLDRFYRLLPWPLTADQTNAISEIRADVESARPMNRLLQGEVGSGKTMVAMAAILSVVGGGAQAALMAPTEILAEQHYINLHPLLDELGIVSALITSGTISSVKKDINSEVLSGKIGVIFGTHALIQKSLKFKRLGLAIIDEQHRFGVRQRLELRKKGKNPDILVMTATPIPRTISLTLFGDLDISTLRELPGKKGIGKNVKTVVCKESDRSSIYKSIKLEVERGRQAYIVYPLVDESDKLQLKSVLQQAETMKEKVFKDERVGIVHGRLSADKKEKVMREFRKGDLDILLSTTVIEVGIDVPNATTILIEHAERFGLSQLHQLRGRVGRGKHSSSCYLFADISSEDAKERMDAITSSSDGFKLAERDLEIRGEGELFGPRQSGLPELRIAKLTKHLNVLELARDEAHKIIDSDQELSAGENQNLLSELKKRFSSKFNWLQSG